ncbi:branched-chain amino acid aminotransferase [Quadrisphaera sp. KR29]|uniref:branched-chain amino acid aminotransferase n=1 Tax=Quadrisphaera sp. KR29 TaxID=3461391 RepID=UPI004044322D
MSADSLQAAAPLAFERQPHPSPVSDADRAAVLADPGFGKHFTDHMAHAVWTAAGGWGQARVEPYGPLLLDPSAAVLHYAQEVFEGMKAYRWADGSVWTFRPQANAARFARSARRLALPELPEADFLASLEALVSADEAWVPTGGETSLYLRPFMFASEAFLGVRPAATVDYLVIASPAGSYFTSGPRPVKLLVSRTYTRAAAGGTGAAKCGGNYAASLLAQQEAYAAGCDQVVFLDAAEQRWVEELGGMNVFLVTADGRLLTPELTGSILEGVTRDSILEIARDLGLQPVEQRIALDDWLAMAAGGEVTEAFACGTAAVVTPIGSFVDGGDTKPAAAEADVAGKVTEAVRSTLLDVQYGRAEDRRGWMHRLV